MAAKGGAQPWHLHGSSGAAAFSSMLSKFQRGGAAESGANELCYVLREALWSLAARLARCAAAVLVTGAQRPTVLLRALAAALRLAEGAPAYAGDVNASTLRDGAVLGLYPRGAGGAHADRAGVKVYLPDGLVDDLGSEERGAKKRVPAVVILPGGSWRWCEVLQQLHTARFFRDSGCAAFVALYRGTLSGVPPQVRILSAGGVPARRWQLVINIPQPGP